jgi:hypothetical protein
MNEKLARETRQAMYVQRNTEAPSRNYCRSGRVIGITYSCQWACSLRYPA